MDPQTVGAMLLTFIVVSNVELIHRLVKLIRGTWKRRYTTFEQVSDAAMVMGGTMILTWALVDSQGSWVLVDWIFFGLVVAHTVLAAWCSVLANRR